MMRYRIDSIRSKISWHIYVDLRKSIHRHLHDHIHNHLYKHLCVRLTGDLLEHLRVQLGGYDEV